MFLAETVSVPRSLLKELYEHFERIEEILATIEELSDKKGLKRIERSLEEYKNKECVTLPPLEEDPAWKMIQNPKHWGIKDASTRIDECLYGS